MRLFMMAASSVFFALTGAAAQSPPAIVIQSTTVIDGRTGAASSNVSLVVEGERITAVGDAGTIRIPEGARLIDGRGRWVIPGLVDVHVHTVEPDALRQFLALGVTTIHSMPPAPPERPRDLESEAARSAHPSPRLHLSPMFTAEFPDNIVPGVYQFFKPRSSGDARRAVQEFSQRGFKSIKIIQDDGLRLVGPERTVPRLAPEVFDALVDEAHEQGTRVYVHAMELKDSRAAVAAGADAFMHGAVDSLLDDPLWEAMRSRRVAWTPTFRVITQPGDYRAVARRILSDSVLTGVLSPQQRSTVEAGLANPPAAQTWTGVALHLSEYLDVLRRNTRQAQSLGVPVAVGSDGGYPGVGTHLEVELLREAGLTAAQVLVAATFGGAAALGVDQEIGTVERGKLADLLILQADPLSDIRNVRRIEWVIKGGHLFRPDELLAPLRETR